MNQSIQHHKLRRWRRTPINLAHQQQDGMALVLALLVGLVLMTGVSGLLARMMSRRLSAKALSTDGGSGRQQWTQSHPGRVK